MGAAFLSDTEDIILPGNPGTLKFILFVAILTKYFLSFRHRGCGENVSTGLVHPNVSCSLHFDQCSFL